MQAIETRAAKALHDELAGVALSVVFASGEEIERVRRDGSGAMVLVAPYHVSTQDAYLVLPEDIGIEIVDIMRDGDLDLLHEAMRDGLLVVGPVERVRKGVVALAAERVETPGLALRQGAPYAAEVALADGDLLEALNDLEHAQCTMISSLVDDEGLDLILREDDHVGTSWRGDQPTFTWSKKLGGDRIGIELALFMEYDELVALLRPACILV